MRRFNSYGPVNESKHFSVPRRGLIEACVGHLVDDPDEGGHYFTIWGPRQTGKTWLMQQAMAEIRTRFGERFVVAKLSMQGVILGPADAPEAFLPWVPGLIRRGFRKKIETPVDWSGWADLFLIEGGLFDRPVILLIDEFDKLPPLVIDRLVSLFRDMYLDRESYQLHGLALIGVRSVLGVDSDRGSPFNVQRSLHVPNLTVEEVGELFRQYREESGQPVQPEVVAALYRVTRGQPGLVSWFGELLTEKYRPQQDREIGIDHWEEVYRAALSIEWNNTMLNLVKKARAAHPGRVIELFGRSDIKFDIDAAWSSYLYMNGIIDHEPGVDPMGHRTYYCRFSSPFVQQRLYNAFTVDLVGDHLPIRALDPLDDLDDVFAGAELDIPALLRRYVDYLERLATAGINPWLDQPRRADLHLTEAVGHFHLYAWLKEAVGRRCVVSPEFPTGNGKVDLHLRAPGKQQGILELKSFVDRSQLREGRGRAARYARQLGLPSVTLAVFVPVSVPSVLEALSGEEVREGVRVTTVAIAWEVKPRQP